MLGGLQTNVLPTSATILRLINTIAIRDAALTVVLARAHPNCQRILWIEDNRANRIRAFVIKHRGPGDAGVDSFPDTPGGDGNKVMGWIGRIYGHGIVGT